MKNDFYISKRADPENIDPAKKTAVSLFKIIQFLFYRVPAEKRFEFFHRLKGKLTRISPGEVGMKRLPPQSAIGHSVGIAKNLLSGLDPVFVRKVLVELSFLLSNIGLKHIKN